MSSSSENDSGAEEGTINGDVTNGKRNAAGGDDNGAKGNDGRIVELLEEEQEGASTPPLMGNGTNRYRGAPPAESASEDESLDALPRRAESPVESILSIPDDSPSVQVSKAAKNFYMSNWVAGLCPIFSWRK